ncbi:MAG: hypothetical protein IT228_00340 [Flavobacteriales bacterium]|nr:hypothetical protein [Flavobacteriales bacterium]MCC6575767.1 hypothetical protein [Flavobacteriales bacterium]NUQ15844.1 hypothetical protein [Flavobacteriales bacterium]
MRTTARALLLPALLGTMATAHGQTEGASFTVTGTGIATTLASDYQSMGINPANLGWDLKYEDPRFVFGLLEASYAVHTTGATRKVLRRDMLRDFDRTFTGNEQAAAATNFGDADLALNADVRLLGFSFLNDDAGGFALGIGDRFQWDSHYNTTTSDLLFLGRRAPYFTHLELADGTVIANRPDLGADTLALVRRGFVDPGTGRRISQLMGDTRMALNWTRAYAFSWGRRLFTTGTVEWHGGIGFRYLQGFAHIDIGEKDGRWQAFSALSPVFDVDYGTAAASNPSTVGGSGMRSVGRGFSGDVGLSVVYKDRLKLGVAATDLGSMVWDGNAYKANDDTLYTLDSPGFTSYNFFDQAEVITSELGILDWDGVVEKRVATPSMLRMGVGYVVPDKAEVGLDVVLPLNEVPGNLTRPQFSLGGEYSPVEFLTLQAGVVTGGNYDTRLPMGLLFRLPSGQWEGGFASRDMLSFFSQNTPTVSLAMGILRFRI